ncbi:MAG: cache domain-containing protein [Bacteroidales bacterium]|nr:cache domain-containing protein [Bacteroidales bacterium]
MFCKYTFWISVTLAFTMVLAACTHGKKPEEHSQAGNYQFAETKELVRFVEDAAKLLSREGTAAYERFREPGSRWCSPSRYLFAYDLHGICCFHPMIGDLVGKDLSGMKDVNGKPVISEIIRIASNPDHPSGWVHYLWAEGDEISPRWKSSYIMKVSLPNGEVLALGSGIYGIKTEKVFITTIVDSASALLRQQGLNAISTLLNNSSLFMFKDTYIFMMDEHGYAIADPSFPGSPRRDLHQLKDALGRPIIEMMRDRLSQQDSAWVTYMWVKANESLPSRKLAYVRKLTIDGKTYILGSSYFLEKPIWMKL